MSKSALDRWLDAPFWVRATVYVVCGYIIGTAIGSLPAALR